MDAVKLVARGPPSALSEVTQGGRCTPAGPCRDTLPRGARKPASGSSVCSATRPCEADVKTLLSPILPPILYGHCRLGVERVQRHPALRGGR
eukprot:6292455-Pyramimonas_sp.AAC.1